MTTKSKTANAMMWFWVAIGCLWIVTCAVTLGGGPDPAEIAAAAAAEAEERRRGFHCLSDWDGTHQGVEDELLRELKDPGSYEHIETRIAPINDVGYHTLTMSYRSRNGFGGMTTGDVIATIDHQDCTHVILQIEERR